MSKKKTKIDLTAVHRLCYFDKYMVFTVVLEVLRNIEFKFYSGTCHDSSVLVHDQKSTVSSRRSQTVITVCIVWHQTLWYCTGPDSFAPGEKVGKKPDSLFNSAGFGSHCCRGVSKKVCGTKALKNPIPYVPLSPHPQMQTSTVHLQKMFCLCCIPILHNWNINTQSR